MSLSTKKRGNARIFLFGAFGHLLCWIGGDLLLHFMPNGALDVTGLFDYEKTVEMLAGVSPVQFTLSGVFGVIAMMLVMPGYFRIAELLQPVTKWSAYIVRIATAFICVAGAVMHFTCTSMLWYFVRSGATAQAHEVMLSFFFETAATSALCNIGVFMVSITLFVAVFRRKTCFPRWASVVNTIPLTLLAGILFAGMGAMNIGSSMMFFGLYWLTKKYGSESSSIEKSKG